jgi:hypothetical protein
MSQLILKRNSIGQNPDDFDVLENGVVVARLFLSPAAPQDRPGAATTATFAAQHTATSRRARRGCQRRSFR